MKDEYGDEITFTIHYFAPGKYGKAIGRPLKTPNGALKKAYTVMKEKKIGEVVIRLNSNWAGGESSSPFATVTNADRGRCKLKYHNKKWTFYINEKGILKGRD